MNRKIATIFTTILIMSGAAHAQKVLDFSFEDNTVGETSGVVLDKSGLDNDGMIHSVTEKGALIVTPGANGTKKALELHGGNDDINDYDSVTVSSNPSLSITNNLTISAWIKKDSYDEPAFSGIVTKTYGAKSGVEPYRYAEYWFSVNEYGDLIFMDNSGINVSTSSQIIKNNKWYYVAVVRDRAKQELKFYVNGKLVETKKGIPAIAGESSDYDVGIGACYPCKYPFKGKIDCVHIFDNALGDDAIKSDMKSCKLPDDNNDDGDNDNCHGWSWIKHKVHDKLPCVGDVDFKLPCKADKFSKDFGKKFKNGKDCFTKFMPKRGDVTPPCGDSVAHKVHDKLPCVGDVDFKLPCNK